MATSFGALCTDFYVNQKVTLKMDLPAARDTILAAFDRVRQAHPVMDQVRRFDDEIALESPDRETRYSWFALTRAAMRSGWVNPESIDEALGLHRLILELAPYYLSVSPIDVDYQEIIYGFDFEAETNRNEVVADVLLGDSVLAGLIDRDQEPVLDAQPFLGLCLNEACDLQAFIEVKTRTRAGEIAEGRFENQPISVYLTVRKYGPLHEPDDLTRTLDDLSVRAHDLAEQRIVPQVILPLREAILSRPG